MAKTATTKKGNDTSRGRAIAPLVQVADVNLVLANAGAAKGAAPPAKVLAPATLILRAQPAGGRKDAPKGRWQLLPGAEGVARIDGKTREQNVAIKLLAAGSFTVEYAPSGGTAADKKTATCEVVEFKLGSVKEAYLTKSVKLTASAGDLPGRFQWKVTDGLSKVKLPSPMPEGGELPILGKHKTDKVVVTCSFIPDPSGDATKTIPPPDRLQRMLKVLDRPPPRIRAEDGQSDPPAWLEGGQPVTLRAVTEPTDAEAAGDADASGQTIAWSQDIAQLSGASRRSHTVLIEATVDGSDTTRMTLRAAETTIGKLTVTATLKGADGKTLATSEPHPMKVRPSEIGLTIVARNDAGNEITPIPGLVDGKRVWLRAKTDPDVSSIADKVAWTTPPFAVAGSPTRRDTDVTPGPASTDGRAMSAERGPISCTVTLGDRETTAEAQLTLIRTHMELARDSGAFGAPAGFRFIGAREVRARMAGLAEDLEVSWTVRSGNQLSPAPAVTQGRELSFVPPATLEPGPEIKYVVTASIRMPGVQDFLLEESQTITDAVRIEYSFKENPDTGDPGDPTWRDKSEAVRGPLGRILCCRVDPLPVDDALICWSYGAAGSSSQRRSLEPTREPIEIPIPIEEGDPDTTYEIVARLGESSRAPSVRGSIVWTAQAPTDLSLMSESERYDHFKRIVEIRGRDLYAGKTVGTSGFSACAGESVRFDTAPMAINLVGVRSMGTNWKPNGAAQNVVTDKFDDLIVQLWKDGATKRCVGYRASVDPGWKGTNAGKNEKGCAHLCNGQWLFKTGQHHAGQPNGGPAGVQYADVVVWRDKDKSGVFDNNESYDKGDFAIHIHWADGGEKVADWSEGCTVIWTGAGFRYDPTSLWKPFWAQIEAASNASCFPYTLFDCDQATTPVTGH